MNKPIYNFFTQDHHRVEGILAQAIDNINDIDIKLYHTFRVELLTHIKMEEKVLFKAAQEANGSEPIPLIKELRLEHGALTTLMVPPPNEELIRVIQYILEKHDEKEEREGGMYDICEKLAIQQTQEILEKIKTMPKTPVHPTKASPLIWETVKRSCARSGYSYDLIAKGYN